MARPDTVTTPLLLVIVIASSPLVALMTIVSAWPSPSPRCAEVDVDLVDVGPGQVVDRDGVRAAQGVDVDGLDVVEVHRDVGDVAGQPARARRWPRCRCSR